MLLRAYAKINLSLEVLARRDDGYHEVATILQTVGLFDLLHLEPATCLRLSCSWPELAGEDNLVWQAAVRLCKLAGCQCGAVMHLEKRIPAAMGLGGGSSDAAAALAGLTELWGLSLSAKELSSLSAELGSDVAFFLEGGTALGQGRGEIISALPPLPQRWVLLVCSDSLLPGKTGRLYQMLEADDYSDGSLHREAVDAITDGRFPDSLLHNAFEKVADKAFGAIYQQARKAMVQAGACDVHLCGSGPGLFSLFESQTQGEQVLKLLKDSGWRAYLVSTTQKGWESTCQG